jgi:hypothetical protein
MTTAELLCHRAGSRGPEDDDTDDDLFSLAKRIACKFGINMKIINNNNSNIIHLNANLIAQVQL